ncbi:hypothetical protein ACH5RR_019382 [Cinchona calisaya]|uniref:Peptidase M48 domain-containing protein n=1 Tax=Cinchona calisaya TaxID=153742 RepID=A0ABD2ZPQ6_9GENT
MTCNGYLIGDLCLSSIFRGYPLAIARFIDPFVSAAEDLLLLEFMICIPRHCNSIYAKLHTVIPIRRLVSFGFNLVSRSFEFQADAFAKKLGYSSPLRAGLVKLQEENLSAMNTDPWYTAYHYSHPSLVERLAALDEPDEKVD